MDKEIIVNKMKERGYSFTFETRDGGGNTTSLVFSYIEKNNEKQRFPVPTYNVIVFPNSDEFQFTYHEQYSINKLETPKCGSFLNDAHFDNIAIKFEHSVAVLNKFAI